MTSMKADLDNPPAILLTTSDAVVPALIAARGRHAGRRFVEFFTANIRNPNTRKAYYRAACEFFDWCDQARLGLLDIEPVHVAAWVEDLGRRFSPPTVKQWLAAVRMLFDWLVVGQVLAVNPAAARCAVPNTLSAPVRPRYLERSKRASSWTVSTRQASLACATGR
jgi:site-specific recombinase XerD